MKLNYFICPVCGHDFYAEGACVMCDACNCSFYASQSRTTNCFLRQYDYKVPDTTAGGTTIFNVK
jgi:hypothetical protein